MLFDVCEVGDEVMDDAGPGFVERLVPDGSCEGGYFNLSLGLGQSRCSGDLSRAKSRGEGKLLCLLTNKSNSLDKNLFTDLVLDQVHFVDQDEDVGTGRVLLEGRQDTNIGGQVAVNIPRLDIEDIDQNPDVGEDMDTLLRQVVLHECLLTTAVP